MFDFGSVPSRPPKTVLGTPYPLERTHSRFELGKRLFDVLFCILLLPPLLLLATGLFTINFAFNPGTLFFVQQRMGRNCTPFYALKFRTMIPGADRKVDEPLEAHRITKLGAFLRQSRIDELPQILNVLRGEMSLIGPRPDCFEHALVFADKIPGYIQRHAVLPGISGYAQTEIGYVVGVEATQRKVAADLHYIENRGLKLEAWIFWRTLKIVAGRCGT